MSLVETQFFSVDSTFPDLAPPGPGKAYDLTNDLDRFNHLRHQYSDQEARLRLLEEMTVDLTTHFAELNRVGAFSYRYLVSQDTLVEDSQAQEPIRNMFLGQDNVISRLWLENIIPTLEQMPPDSFIFTYSARQKGKFEGGYDYAYIFHKTDSSTINAHGLELVLSPIEQAAVLNRLYQDEGQMHLLLTDSPDPDEIRGRAFWFPPGNYSSAAAAYAHIIGSVIKPLRQNWPLETSADYQAYLIKQEQLLTQQTERSRTLASNLVQDFDTVPLATLQSRLATEQQKDLWRLYPDLMAEVAHTGLDRILLPCGFIDLNSGFDLGDLRFTSGQSLVETTTWSYHSGTCRHCHATGVEVGPCDICRQCEKIL